MWDRILTNHLAIFGKSVWGSGPPLSSLAEKIFGSGPEPYGMPPAIAVDPPGINTCCRVAGPAREGSGADPKICSSPRGQGGPDPQTDFPVFAV